MVFEEFNRLRHRHFENIVNGTTAPLHLEAFSRVSLAMTHIAGDPNIGKEIHFQFDGTAPAACFAASTLDVEAEVAGFVAALFGEFCVGEEASDFIKHFRVSRRIGARSSPNRGLVDDDDFVHVFHSFNGGVFAWKSFGAVNFPLQCWSENA